jgi:hypothetical protein
MRVAGDEAGLVTRVGRETLHAAGDVPTHRPFMRRSGPKGVTALLAGGRLDGAFNGPSPSGDGTSGNFVRIRGGRP